MKIDEKLKHYMDSAPVSFAMPGHKMRGLAPVIDVTELDTTVDLHHNSKEVQDSSKMLADFYGADKSLYLVGGATAGIFAMLYSVCRPGDTIAAGRACHKAVMNACIFLGIKIVLIPQKEDPVYHVPEPLEKEAVEQALKRYPQIRAVLITSPDYYGVCANIREIAALVHQYHIPLLADEAHGAHFKISKLLPTSAIELGADMAVQSAHKTLGALTPSAFLHIKKGLIDINTVQTVSAMIQTSSPPYYVVSSAERILLDILENGAGVWEHIIGVIQEENKRLKRETEILVMEDGVRDITRIVFGFSRYHTTGAEIGQALQERFGIDVEMTDAFNIVCIATAYNTEDEIRYLYRAVKEICGSINLRDCAPVTEKMPYEITQADPQSAFYGKKQKCRIKDAAGYTAASNIGAYPPGIPVVYMGEVITKEAVQYIEDAQRHGVKVQGVQNLQVVE